MQHVHVVCSISGGTS